MRAVGQAVVHLRSEAVGEAGPCGGLDCGARGAAEATVLALDAGSWHREAVRHIWHDGRMRQWHKT